MQFAYGRRRAVHTAGMMRSMFAMAAALDPLGSPPPAGNDYTSAVKVPWGLYGNDTLGDCVCCDTAHTLMLRTANASSIVVPSQDDVIHLYSAVGGYVPGDEQTDNGCEEAAMCDYLRATGFLGHKADATGAVDYYNLDHLKWCIQLFGTCRIGLNLPGYAEDQFSADQPWDVSSTGNQSVGGHDVPLVGYKGDVFTCVTWGRLQQITGGFLLKYCEEAWAELWGDWIASQGIAPSGLSLNDLSAKLKEVA